MTGKTDRVKKTKRFAEVAVEVPIDRTFTYSIPSELADSVEVGRRVLVPFGRRTLTGYVTGIINEAGVEGVKQISDVLDSSPLFDEKRLEFFRWLASYYFAPIGEVLSLIRPAGATIQSRTRVAATPEGTEALASATGVERAVLEAAGKGVMADTLARRLRGRPVYSATERLRKRGLVTVEVQLKGGGREKTERFVRPVVSPGDVDDGAFTRSPAQREIFDFLWADGNGDGAALKQLSEEFASAPSAVKRLAEKGIVEVTDRVVRRDPMSDVTPKEIPHTPNPDQKSAIDEITRSMKSGGYAPYLLHGVTGSGKTLVYLEVLEEAIRAGKKAVFLAPEISLTPWPAAFLARKFPGRVAIAHSGLSEGERFDEWRRVVEGRADIVVGARSALFSPLRDVGLIIVDEEHETSYKQEDGVRYNARDAALMLGRYLGITVVLGSATPSVESFHNAANGKLRPLVIKGRVMERAMPEVEVVDMRGRKGQVLSEELKTLVEENLAGGHQSLLFLNRRGFSSFLICKDCGHTFDCPNCSVTLTMHKHSSTLLCHYCDTSAPVPHECPRCRGLELITPGIGTEKVEEEVRELFDGARTARMDRDTTRRKGSVKKIIDAVEAREVDILVGTQMVSKGHDFPGVTLVGVISGDTSLNIPDFRSAERTFQLITQAAGRAGRGEAPGRVIIQTLNPDHYCFTNAAEHDYQGFYDTEIGLREDLGYPPFSRLCCLRIEGAREDETLRAASSLVEAGEALISKLGQRGLTLTMLGPAPALLARVRNRYRWNVLVKGRELKTLHSFVAALKRTFVDVAPRGVTLAVDMDPLTVV